MRIIYVYEYNRSINYFSRFLTSKQGRGQLHIEYKNLLVESFNSSITHIYFIQYEIGICR